MVRSRAFRTWSKCKLAAISGVRQEAIASTVKVEYGKHTGWWGFVVRLRNNDTVAIILHQDEPSNIIEVHKLF